MSQEFSDIAYFSLFVSSSLGQMLPYIQSPVLLDSTQVNDARRPFFNRRWVFSMRPLDGT